MKRCCLLVLLLVVMFFSLFSFPAWASGDSPDENLYYPTRTIGELYQALNVLNHSKWVEMYTPNIFDCSNMTALLDAILDLVGFDSYIVYGRTYTIINGKMIPTVGHAMLYVQVYNEFTEQVNAFWVEATTLTAFPVVQLAGNSYFIPTGIFADAYRAYMAMPHEFTVSQFDVDVIYNSLTDSFRDSQKN